MTTWRSWIRSSDNNDGALAMRLRFPAGASQCDNSYDTSQTNRKYKNIYVLVNEVESVKQDWRALLQGGILHTGLGNFPIAARLTS